MTGRRRGEEIRKVAADLAALLDELEVVVEILTAGMAGEDYPGNEEEEDSL